VPKCLFDFADVGFIDCDMFLRKKTYRKPDGAASCYWQLVESYRTERGPRQRVVAHLGEVDETDRLGIKQFVKGQDSHQPSLFEEETSPSWVEVNITGVNVERTRRFGDVWLALELMKKLGLPDFFHSVLPSPRAKIPWADLATILVAARFCDARSELSVAEHFYQSSSLPDLMGIPPEDVYDNRLYRTLDVLVDKKDQLQQYLKNRLGELFDIQYDILLYDVTSTYFEGEAKRNPMAKRGYSRDSRPDCKQVTIGLVVTTEGIPLGYEVFEGNRHDSKTVEEIVRKMESMYGKSNRIWVMDRGMVSKENYKLLQASGRRYIVGTPKSQLKKFEQHLLDKQWEQVHQGLEVKLCPSPEGGDETFILCRSTARQQKEQAMHERFRIRIEEGLQKLKQQCDAGRLKESSKVERRIGKLLGENTRASAMFDISVSMQKGKILLEWSMKKQATQWASLSEGCYLLRTNIKDWTGEQLWKTYIQLTEAEAAFRIHKDDLQLRPVWHQKKERVKAHILVCFLTYVLWKCFAQMCKNAGLGNEPRKVIEEIKQLTMMDILLPTRNGINIRLRCVSKPDPPLQILLQRLKLNPPQRLQRKSIL
jgi:transposase